MVTILGLCLYSLSNLWPCSTPITWTVYVSTTASSVFRTIRQTVTAFRKTFLVSRQQALLFSQLEVAQHSGYTTCCNMQSDPFFRIGMCSVGVALFSCDEHYICNYSLEYHYTGMLLQNHFSPLNGAQK